MIVWNAMRETLRHIVRNPMRSALTMLGIMIGVAAVIAMISLGRGAAARVDKDLSGLGQNLMFVVPGTPAQGRVTVAPPFDDGDGRAIQREIDGVAAVAPTVARRSAAVYGGATWTTSVTGSTADYLRVMSWQIGSGRAFTAAELRTGAPVAMLGATPRRELFGGLDPIGAAVRIGNVSVHVVGVLAPKGSATFGQDQDDFILVPLATHQRRISGTHDVDMLFLSTRDGADTAQVRRDLETLLRARRHLHPGEANNFTVRDMKEISGMVSSITGVLTQLLAAIAGVSLLVGGIGIMNIMLVAVSERTREIGIRLAVGARARDVLLQFLVEAIVLSAVGGVIGIGLGLAGSYAAIQKLAIPFKLDAVLVALPFTFSAAVGVIFGFFPARKAARLDPIEALRHE